MQELTIDEVARRAGISRSLLFHYFATKRDYYSAVTRAAADLLWAHLLPRPGTPPDQQVSGMLDRYVGWVETYRDTHLSFVRGAAGGDPWVAEVYEETRGRLVDVALRTLGAAGRRPAAVSWCWPGSPSPRTSSRSGRRSRPCRAPTCWSSCATCSTGWSANRPGTSRGRLPPPAPAGVSR